MNKKLLLVVTLILVVSLFAATAVVVAKETLVPLTLINRSDQLAAVSLTSDNLYYYLIAAPGATKVYTVERKVYDRTTYSCGLVDTGTVDILSQMRLVFTSCPGKAPNMGEPTQEKVHIDDSPDGLYWRYK